VRSSGRHRPAGMSASAAVQMTAERGTDVAALDMKINLLRPVHPDGQQLVATGTVLYGGRRLVIGRPRSVTAAGSWP
jgi:acyl-coenzyme A thioesterase PaaI-like protein